MNEEVASREGLAPRSRTQRLLLGTLFCLSVADGILTRFIISNGLGREGNFWLSDLASSDALIGIKMLGTVLAIYLLWRLHYVRPKLVMATTVSFVGWYTLVVFWNIIVIVIGSK
jgi:hypothetical protein